MVKHFKKIMAISTLLFILLIIIPGSYANENQTDLQMDAPCDVLADVRVDIYFDASANEDGDGSIQNPYKTIDSSRLRNNTNIYLEEGQYDAYLDMCVLENCSIYGKNPEKTIIISSTFHENPNIITNGNFAVSNVTFANTHFEAKNDFKATNTNFETYVMYYYAQGYICAFEEDNVNMNLDNCTFYSCFGDYGGAIYIVRGNLNIRNSKFRDNFAYGDGGAIWLYNVTSTIINSTFEGNRAYNEGGAVYYFTSDLTFINSTFIDNRAKLGGAIHSYKSPLQVVNCTFDANNATSCGGSVYAYRSNVTITKSNFKGDNAHACGGSVHVCGLSEAKITDCNFDKSTSEGVGAALYSEASLLSLNNVNITNCRASFGAAVTTLIGNSSLSNVIFRDNGVKYNGGAIYQIYGDLAVNDCQFKENNAEKGGAFYLNTVSISDFNSNKFNNNKADNGLDIYLMAMNDTKLDSDSIDVYSRDVPEIFIGNGNYTLLRVNDTFDGELPSRYNSADYGYVTSVKDQADGGYCWAFTAIAVLESCAAKASGVHFDFSENNLINLNKMFSDYGLATNDEAGNTFNALGYLLSWLGPVDENLDEYDDHSKISPVLNSTIHVQNVLFLDVNATNNLELIKDAIIRYGAVGTALFWNWGFCNGSSYYFDYGQDNMQNHAITLVGWDDNYSRYNFADLPPADGAWIAKNSWGDYVGDGGYFYISYYSQSMHYEPYKLQNYPVVDRLFTFIFNDTIRLDKNYQYDFVGSTIFQYFQSGTTFKNIFKSTEDEYLAAVSTYFMQDTQYDINIYVNGKLVHNQSSTTKQGYYTINLERIIPLKANDTFEVAFKMKSLYDDSVMALVSQASEVTKNSTYRQGTSFFHFDGDSDDMWFDKGASEIFCIKAFTILNELKTSLDLTVDYNNRNPVNITAYVLDEYGRKITYGNVTFNLEGRQIIVNVTDGFAELTHNFRKGVSTITATYNGLGYVASTDSVDVDVYKEVMDLNLSVSTYLNTASVIISTPQKISSLLEVEVNNKTRMMILMNGKATLDLDDLPNGDNEITASLYDCQEYDARASETFVIEVVQPKIVSCDFVTYENSKADYTIKFVDDKSNPVSGKTVKFNINGQDFENVSDGEGIATLTIDLSAGNYKITTSFAGDGMYLPANVTNSIKVKEVLSATVNVIMNYRDVNVDIHLSKSIGIDLKVDVNHITHKVTALNGRANLKLDNLKNGDYNILVYLTDDAYNFTNIENNININVFESKIIADDLTTIDDDKDSYTVKLLDIYNNPLDGKSINFNINGCDFESLTDSEGIATLPLDLAGGKYNILTTFAGDEVYMPANSSNDIRVKTNLAANIVVVKDKRTAFISLNLSKDVDVDLILSVNGKNQTINSKDILKLDNLPNKEYNLCLYLNNDDYIFKSEQLRFTINIIETRLQAEDLVTYLGSDERYTVKLVDMNGEGIEGKTINFKFNNKDLKAQTDEEGTVSIPVSSLAVGNYRIEVTFDDFKNYIGSAISNNITVKSTIALPTSSVYSANSSYSVRLYDELGNPLNDKTVEFDINGKTVQAKCANGIATLNIDFALGNYTIKVTNPVTGEVKTQKISVRTCFIENKDITMYYGAGKTYKVKVLDENGNNAIGVLVTVKIGSVSKTVPTDVDGYASYKISQKPGKYTITVEYNGFNVSNKVTVKTTIVTKNKSVKKGKTFKFTAKILSSKGKILKNKQVKFKFNGKTYKIKTDKNGIATLKVTKKLKVGKYTVKTTYGKLTVSNKITIKK